MWISKIKKRKIQMLLIGLVVMISSFMLSSAIGIITSVSEPMNRLIEETKAPVLFMTVDKNGTVDKDLLDVKKAFQKDSRVSQVNIIDNIVMASGKIKANNKYMGTAVNYFLNYKEGDFGSPKFIKGGGNLEQGECFISSIIAETYKLSTEDYITVENPKGDIKMKIKGIYSDPYSTSIGMGIYRYYVNDKQLKDITGADKKMVTVYSNAQASAKEIIKNYKNNSDKQLSASIIDLDTAKMSAEISQQIIGAFVAAFAFIILLVSAVVIRVSIFDSIIKEYKTIGVYKALGYSSSTIVNIYLKAYSTVIIASAATGSLLSIFMMKYILNTTFKVYGVDVKISHIMPAVLTILLVVVLMVISIYGVIGKTKRISPVEALSLGMPVNNKKGVSLRFVQNNFSPISQGFRKILNYKKFSVILFSILFICSYVVAFSITNYNNFSVLSEKSSFWFGLDDAKYRITITDRDRGKDIYTWMKNSGYIKNLVKENLDYSSAEVSKGEIDEDGSIVLSVYEQYDKDIRETVIEGRNPKYDNEIAVSKKLLEKTHRAIGDYIDIYIKGQKKNLLITGSYQSMIRMGMNARVLEKTVESADKDYESTNISFNLKAESDYGAFKEQAVDKFGKAIDVYESKDYFKDVLQGVMEPQRATQIPFMCMLILIGAINVFSIITLMNLNNKRDYCIYKAIGYSSRDLMITNGMYVMILGVLATIVCIPVFSIIFPITMNLIFSMFGIYNYPANVEIHRLLISLLFSMGIYFISTILSSLSIRKFKVQELNED